MLQRPRRPLTQQLVDDLTAIESELRYARSIAVPWLLVHGSRDEIVRVQDSADMVAAAGDEHPPTFVELPGIDYSFTGAGIAPMARVVVPRLVAALSLWRFRLLGHGLLYYPRAGTPARTLALRMRTTLVSYRALDCHPGRCYDYEFEDLFIDLVGAELIAPLRPEPGTFLRRRHEDTLASVPLSGTQDLLFVNVMSVWDLHALLAIPEWRTGSKLALCWIKEFFACTDIPRPLLQVLQQFDLVILNFGGSVESLQQRLPGTEVMHMPLGIDTLRFNPYPASPPRSIDMHWVGRHSIELNEQLFELAKREGLYYQFNSAYADHVTSHRHHRVLFSSMMKRTNLFIVQPAKFNDPKTTGGQEELGYRYFEGASSGAQMAGHAPHGASPRKLFPWQDALIELPRSVAEVPEVISELLGRDWEEARRTSVVHCLRHHDWVYRIEAILSKIGISDAAAVVAIKTRCDELQKAVEVVAFGSTNQLLDIDADRHP
jgi:hypothetical protein